MDTIGRIPVPAVPETGCVRGELGPGLVRAQWWSRLSEDESQCELCPCRCVVSGQQIGLCGVRRRRGQELVLTAYGKALSWTAVRMEELPLRHFFPGTMAMSVVTPGDTPIPVGFPPRPPKHSRTPASTPSRLTPKHLADVARAAGCDSIVFAGFDGTVVAEYIVDCAQEARARGLKTVLLTKGYVGKGARSDIFSHMDAVNVDLQTFRSGANGVASTGYVEAVLDNARWLAQQTGCWIEVTYVVVPQFNDSNADVAALCSWLLENMGSIVPLHLMVGTPVHEPGPCPAAVVRRVRQRALRAGISHVYNDNVFDADGQVTSCSVCKQQLISRRAGDLAGWQLRSNTRCPGCGTRLSGRFGRRPPCPRIGSPSPGNSSC